MVIEGSVQLAERVPGWWAKTVEVTSRVKGFRLHRAIQLTAGLKIGKLFKHLN